MVRKQNNVIFGLQMLQLSFLSRNDAEINKRKTDISILMVWQQYVQRKYKNIFVGQFCILHVHNIQLNERYLEHEFWSIVYEIICWKLRLWVKII